MMKHIIFTGALLLTSAMTGEAIAACGDVPNQVTDAALPTLLANHTVCDATAKYDTCTKHPGPNCVVQMGIQEEHRAGGQLWDYKRGATNTIDPTTQVGNWSVSGSGANTVVNYTYLGGGGPGSYTVFNNNDGSYDFCNGAVQVAKVTIVNNIGVGCGFP
jgi:hypothetical protein